MSKLRYRPFLRCALLFSNFFLIITALYHLKPVSRSIFLEAIGSDLLPYVWIATALTLGAIVSFYYRLVARYSRLHVVITSVLIVIALLVVFRPLLVDPDRITAFAFYIFVDILSVVLVEQFWSITNSVYSEEEGRRWYAFIGTGGLVGGVAGGLATGILIRQTSLQSTDLLLVAAAILSLLILLTMVMYRTGLYRDDHAKENGRHVEEGSWRAVLSHRYLKLIAAIVLLAQIIEPLIEYQFMTAIESAISGREERTAYLGEFFSLLGLIAISVNLLIVPVVHRWLGVMAGLAAQPLAVVVSSLFYISAPGLAAGAALKIADRGLSYSINRASKELLYASVNPLLIFQAKAWIDMFGYRLFRIIGSLLILLLTQWLPLSIASQDLSWLVLLVCMLWGLSLVMLGREHARRMLHGEKS
ncbi:ATP:ADP antiporter, AAA family [Mariprofundus ferrinatatus]|uniref:ADP,ATP carrier protein n=1 Tax=Mariprofundus ferrinatatus TaxID=1921087 RepID=A0A2K8LBK6_9PROT|nr:Npt1/Npt2 family nucleotide transporter [Mariprofundus ferrinatatus]ATX82304.1 ATP:ADP antiporter, AAA family [Mariprofundus ferrinatatus]